MRKNLAVRKYLRSQNEKPIDISKVDFLNQDINETTIESDVPDFFDNFFANTNLSI